MRATLWLVALVLAIPACARARAADVPASMVNPAIAIQTSLAHDSMDGVQANAATIADEAAKIGKPAAKIAGAARDLQKQTKIADARVAFGTLSEALVAFLDGQKLSPGDGVKVAFCPMVLKPWLQKEGAINNPYFGSQMLGCGSFRK